MKKHVMIKILRGGGIPRFILPKGGAHWAEPCSSSATFGDRRSEA